MESEINIKELLDNMEIGVVLVSNSQNSQKIVYHNNSQITNMLKSTIVEEDTVGKSLNQVFPIFASAELRAELDTVIKTGNSNIIQNVKLQNGNNQDHQLDFRFNKYSDQAFIISIIDTKKAENRYYEKLRKLIHDLNNTMTILSMNLYLMDQEKDISEQGCDSLKSIKEAVDDAKRLLKQIG